MVSTYLIGQDIDRIDNLQSFYQHLTNIGGVLDDILPIIGLSPMTIGCVGRGGVNSTYTVKNIKNFNEFHM